MKRVFAEKITSTAQKITRKLLIRAAASSKPMLTAFEILNRVERARLMKITVDVPDGTSGAWKVETFEVSKSEAEFFNIRAMYSGSGMGRCIRPGEYKRLMRNRDVIMSNTPSEISDHVDFIIRAKQSKRILINGLGLGVCLKAILESDKVEEVTVIEKSEDVIKLVAPTFQNDKRVKIIHADAFTWKPPRGARYDAVWHDIWDYICGDNLSEMSKLHRKYGKRTDFQRSWCKKECQKLNRQWW